MRALHFSPNMCQTTVLFPRRRPVFHGQSLTVASTVGRPAATLGCAVRGQVKASPALLRCIATLVFRPVIRVLQIACAPRLRPKSRQYVCSIRRQLSRSRLYLPQILWSSCAANSCGSHKHLRSRSAARAVSPAMLLRVPAGNFSGARVVVACNSGLRPRFFTPVSANYCV